jgi:hypothetical protein
MTQQARPITRTLGANASMWAARGGWRATTTPGTPGGAVAVPAGTHVASAASVLTTAPLYSTRPTGRRKEPSVRSMLTIDEEPRAEQTTLAEGAYVGHLVSEHTPTRRTDHGPGSEEIGNGDLSSSRGGLRR